MEHKIIIPENITYHELKHHVDNGAQFIIYQYCISIFFAVSLTKLSPAFLILPHEESTKYKSKYDWYTRVFGWWCIPWGPINVVKSLKVNNKGGIDVTKDIMLNLNEEAIQSKSVQMVKMHNIFGKPEKSDVKELGKCVKSIHPKENITSVVAGLFLNTEDNLAPYLVIGVNGQNDFEHNVSILNTVIYKRYRKHVYFEFIDLNDMDNDISQKLVEQGERLM